MRERDWTREIELCESLEELRDLAREMAEKLESAAAAAYDRMFYE